MEILALLLVVPVAWPFIAKAVWKHELTWQELSMNIIIASLLATGMWFAGRYAEMADTEIVNGQVVGKNMKAVSCEHSYSCNCRTSDGKTTCDTCYEHSEDYDWILHTNALDEKIRISRVDRQGVTPPPRYLRAQAGDPVSLQNRFMNYVKAVKGSLFYDKGEILTSLPLPSYPDAVYDYHYVNRALSVQVPVPDVAEWNKDIANLLKTAGPAKQANLIYVFAKTPDPKYAMALEREWIGGKKNDVIVVIGSTEYPRIDWVRVLSWTDKKDFIVALGDQILDIGTLDRQKIVAATAANIQKSFERKHMRDFDYLKWEIEPPLWVSILAFILSALCSVGLSVFFSRNDVTYGKVFAGVGALLAIGFRR